MPPVESSEVLDFTDLRAFQDAQGSRQWRLAINEAMRDRSGPPRDVRGLPQLRKALAEQLKRERGVQVDPEDILIVAGIQQARDLIARVLVQKDLVVGIEDPAYRGIRATFTAAGARVVSCAVGEHGLDVDLHATELSEAKLLYVMPSQQFPTGVVMPEAQRHHLLAWAYRQGAYVIEDDFEAEHRLVSRASPPLYAIDQREQVIHIGAFAREFFPSMRMGYVIAPRALRPFLAAAKWVADRGASFMLQRILARYLASGEYQRNLRRLFVLLDGKRERLVASLERRFGARVKTVGSSVSGALLVHLTGVPRSLTDRLIALAGGKGVRITSAHVYYMHAPACIGLLLRYTHLPVGRIDEAVRRLVLAYDELVLTGSSLATVVG